MTKITASIENFNHLLQTTNDNYLVCKVLSNYINTSYHSKFPKQYYDENNVKKVVSYDVTYDYPYRVFFKGDAPREYILATLDNKRTIKLSSRNVKKFIRNRKITINNTIAFL